jgi:hypothetical protein
MTTGFEQTGRAMALLLALDALKRIVRLHSTATGKIQRFKLRQSTL